MSAHHVIGHSKVHSRFCFEDTWGDILKSGTQVCIIMSETYHRKLAENVSAQKRQLF
jgi:hypothetical protein